MGITDKVKGLANDFQDGVKTTSVGMVSLTLRMVTGFFLGLTMGLIGQELIGYGNLGLLFFTLVILGVFVKLSSSWSIAKILIFDLFCILVAQLLRMYILLAP